MVSGQGTWFVVVKADGANLSHLWPCQGKRSTGIPLTRWADDKYTVVGRTVVNVEHRRRPISCSGMIQANVMMKVYLIVTLPHTSKMRATPALEKHK